MKTYTITKSQLLEFYHREINNNKSNLTEKVALPNKELNVRVPKSGIVNFIATGNDKEGWMQIVPAERKTQKILKLNQDQFAVLLLNLMAQKAEDLAQVSN
jgi:hypothetical protein